MAQAPRRIVTELHDEPHVEGRRVTVRRIRGLVEGAGKPATEVAERFDIDVADVYAALQYYHTHPDEMERVERRRHERETDVRRRGGQSLEQLGGDHDGESDGTPDPG
jgi:uncharacterized protein (DUF433 family)